MPTFRYKAVNESNEVIHGEMEAPARTAVIEQLRGLGQLPLNAREIESRTPLITLEPGSFTLRRVTSREVLLITHELATLLKAGVALDRAFEILIELCDKGPTQRLLRRILGRLRSGVSLAEALVEYRDPFPRYYASMVRAGEASGALDVILSRLADLLEKSQKLRDNVKTALYYPVFLLIMAATSIVVMLTFVVPQFEPLFESAGATLPLSTKILVALGNFLQNYGWLCFVALIAISFAIRRYLSAAAGRRRWDAFVLRVPFIGDVLTKVEVARFSRTASTLLQSGNNLLNTLSIVRDTLSNTVMASSIDTVAAQLKEGRGLAEPLRMTGLFPPLVVHLLRVGEETGQLENMLAKLADIYDEEVGHTTARLLAMLVPVLTIGMGVLIAAIIGSILTAILSVNTLAF
jgi:general secretion pathway protein F